MLAMVADAERFGAGTTLRAQPAMTLGAPVIAKNPRRVKDATYRNASHHNSNNDPQTNRVTLDRGKAKPRRNDSGNDQPDDHETRVTCESLVWFCFGHAV
jgi:hypothetical protein